MRETEHNLLAIPYLANNVLVLCNHFITIVLKYKSIILPIVVKTVTPCSTSFGLVGPWWDSVTENKPSTTRSH